MAPELESSIEFPEIDNFEQEESILKALEEDTGIDFSESKAINEESNKALQECATMMTERIIKNFREEQGYLPPDKALYLRHLAETAIFLTDKDFTQSYLYSETRREEHPIRKKVLRLKLKTGLLDNLDIKTTAFIWTPFAEEDEFSEVQFLLFRLPSYYTSKTYKTKRDLMVPEVTEELLHSIDQLRRELDKIDTEQAAILGEAAARTYALEVLPDWIRDSWYKEEKDFIEGWRKLEQKFGEDPLKGAYFDKAPGIDYQRLIERSKDIWKGIERVEKYYDQQDI